MLLGAGFGAAAGAAGRAGVCGAAGAAGAGRCAGAGAGAEAGASPLSRTMGAALFRAGCSLTPIALAVEPELWRLSTRAFARSHSANGSAGSNAGAALLLRGAVFVSGCAAVYAS